MERLLHGDYDQLVDIAVVIHGVPRTKWRNVSAILRIWRVIFRRMRMCSEIF